MSKQDSLRTQNCILKVTIDCNGCAQKVKKRLKKIQGVNSVSVDAEQGKVVVTGDKVDPSKLIKKLKSSGMHAELLNGGQQKDMNLSNQFQNFQISSNSIKGEKDNKSKKVVHDFKLPQKAQKSVKFNLKEEKFDASDDGHDDLEEYSDDDDEEEEERYGHGHATPMMRNGVGPGGPTGMMNGPNHKGNNGHGKNGHVIDPTMVIKGKSGNRILNNNAKKGYKVEKQKNEDQSDNENNEKVKYMVGGGEGDGIKKKNAKSSGGGLVGRFLRFGKKSKKGADDNYNYKNIDIKEEKGDGKLDGGGKSKNGKGNNGNMGQVGPIGMNYPIDIRAVQKHPPMNGGGGYQHPQGVQMQMQMQPPSYNQQQQQQYMAVMMNQQHQQQQHQQQQYQQQGYMNNMYPQAMMYGRQQPSMNYMPPPPPMPVHPMNDPMTHTFSDENVEGCTMM